MQILNSTLGADVYLFVKRVRTAERAFVHSYKKQEKQENLCSFFQK